jgi:hypothetical protein
MQEIHAAWQRTAEVSFNLGAVFVRIKHITSAYTWSVAILVLAKDKIHDLTNNFSNHAFCHFSLRMPTTWHYSLLPHYTLRRQSPYP